MFTLFRRLVVRIFAPSLTQPPRPGSFTFDQIPRIDYKEDGQVPTPSPEPLTAVVVEEEQPTERKEEAVAIPMQALAVEEVETVERVEEPQPADILPSEPSPVPVVVNQPAALIPARQEQPRELAKVFQTVRPELNIEKHADFIFAPSHSKNLNKPRSRTWLETSPDGKQVKASLVVEPFRGKIPTTKTRRVYLALHQLFEDKGWSEEESTTFSLYEIAQALGMKWHGKTTVKQLRAELLQLRMTPFIWEYSFTDANGDKAKLLDTFNILDRLKIFEKADREKNQLFLALSSFRFHEAIRQNLKANRTKPTNLVALELKGEIASVLYAHLDIIMANKEHYERTTEGLFTDLRLEGAGYQKPSIRKQKLDKAIKELDSKPLSTGVLHLTLEKTKDGKDWKLVAKKTPLKEDKQKALTGKIVEPANPPEAIPHLARDLADTLGGYGQYRQLYEKLYKTYSADLVYQAMREWNADGGRNANRPLAFFLAVLHRLAHQRGKLWIKPCPLDCKHQPQT